MSTLYGFNRKRQEFGISAIPLKAQLRNQEWAQCYTDLFDKREDAVEEFKRLRPDGRTRTG